jgi:hypothetical protein
MVRERRNGVEHNGFGLEPVDLGLSFLVDQRWIEEDDVELKTGRRERWGEKGSTVRMWAKACPDEQYECGPAHLLLS